MNKQDESFKDFFVDQLSAMDSVEARRMFGGHGLYQDETFFGIVHRTSCFSKSTRRQSANTPSAR